MHDNPITVIIVILTYNLEKYVRQAIDSVLNQKTTYKYKILIGDDHSTDRTPQILMEYKEKYPDKIEIRFSDKNLGCLANSNRLFDGLDCEYFSLLDGDDFWVDEEHLQKQIDFLENNREYSTVAGNTQYIRNEKLSELLLPDTDTGRTFTFDDLLNNKCPYYHPSSTMFRNLIYRKGLPNCYKDAVDTFENCALRGDDFRRIQHLQEGKVYIMPEILSCYRIHNGGIWQGATELKRRLEGAIENNFFRKYYLNTSYFEHFNKSFAGFYRNMMKYLILNNDIINQYTIDEKTTELFTALLQDLSRVGIPFEEGNKLKFFEYKEKMPFIKRVFRKLKNMVHRIIEKGSTKKTP